MSKYGKYQVKMLSINEKVVRISNHVFQIFSFFLVHLCSSSWSGFNCCLAVVLVWSADFCCMKTGHVNLGGAPALIHLPFLLTAWKHFDKSFYHDKQLYSLLFSGKQHRFHKSTNAEHLKFIYTGKYIFHISFVSCLRSIIPLSSWKIFSDLLNTNHIIQKRMYLIWNTHLCMRRCMCTYTQRCSSRKRANTFTVHTQTQKHSVTNTHSKQYLTKHERRLMCRYSKHRGEI